MYICSMIELNKKDDNPIYGGTLSRYLQEGHAKEVKYIDSNGDYVLKHIIDWTHFHKWREENGYL